MNNITLAALVLETLDAQQKYFKSRTFVDLGASKQLEQRLREMATQALAQAEQPGLFDAPPSPEDERLLALATLVTQAREIAGNMRASQDAWQIHNLLIDAEHDLWILRGEPND